MSVAGRRGRVCAMPCAALSPACPLAVRYLPQRPRRRVSATVGAAGARGPCSDSGGGAGRAGASARGAASAPAGAGAGPNRARQLRQLQQHMAAHAERLELYVQQQDFAAAALERDAIQALELQARRIELEEAAAATAGVHHRLGTVIQHRRYSYRGVIVGFDPVCLAPEEWIQMMRVDLLPLGRQQPFYHVLVDERFRPNAQMTYVAQENILPMRVPREVVHPLLPNYFTSFSPEEGGYVPGPHLRQQYPHEF